MRDSETFAANAERCHTEAAEATLDNVRDRALRSEAAWRAMAQRSTKTEALREARQARELQDIAPEVFAEAKSAEG